MKKVAFKDCELRDAARREIEKQVDDFLKKGGEIERLESPITQAQPKGMVWRPRVGSFEM